MLRRLVRKLMLNSGLEVCRKIRLYILPVIILSNILGGCGDQACNDGNTPCGNYSICCDETQCYYEVDDGTRFDCDGTDCTAAARELAEYQCAPMKNVAPEEFFAMIENILAAADEQVATASAGQ